MRSLYILFFAVFVLVSCKNKTETFIEATYPDGSPKIARQYENNNLVKETTYYTDNKKQSEGDIADNKKDGKWTFWYDNGNKWSEGYFRNGIRHGKAITWYMNGKKRYEGYYKNGKPAGTWKFWDESGKFIKEVKY